MKQFNRYKALKEKLDIRYRGIKFNKVLALTIWNIANRTHHFSIRQLVRFILSLDFKDFKVCTDRSPLLATYGLYDRRDRQELYYNIINPLGDYVVSNNLLHFKRKLTLNFGIIIYFIRQVFEKLQKSKFSFVEKLIISALFVNYANILKEIEKIDVSKVRKYLSMCSVLDVENLLTQYMINKGVKTFSLQDGIFFIFKENPPIDSAQYENFETDCLLCWGQYSVDQYSEYGISKERLIVAGYPKNIIAEKIKENNSFFKVIVLLARASYQATNIQLMHILLKYTNDYSFFLKLHPSCDLQLYQNYINHTNIEIIPTENTVTDCLTKDNFDFAIAVNTTAYYESLMRGIPCLRFADGSFDLMHGYDDVFYDENNFLNRINEIKNKPIVDYQRDIDFVLKYAIGLEIDNYKEVLLSEYNI